MLDITLFLLQMAYIQRKENLTSSPLENKIRKEQPREEKKGRIDDDEAGIRWDGEERENI